MSRTIRFTSHKAAQDALNELLIVMRVLKDSEQNYYTDIVDGIKLFIEEQCETILLLTSEKLGRVFASEHYQDMDTPYPANPIPR